MNIDKKLMIKLDAAVRAALESDEVVNAVEGICDKEDCSASIEVIIGFHKTTEQHKPVRKQRATRKSTSDKEFVKFMKKLGAE